MNTLYLYHDDFLVHDTGPGHPECSARLTAINQALQPQQNSRLTCLTPVVDRDIEQLILLVHSRKLFDSISAHAGDHQGYHYVDADTVISPGSVHAAYLAVSSACMAVDQIMQGSALNAFCAVRPPGHHAQPGRAMGFCLFNTVAIAAAYAHQRYQVERIAIVDFDVHHGNGTQAAFYDTPEVLYASTHEMPNYPGTGYPDETGVGNISNVPLPPGASGRYFREQYRQHILPRLRKFDPDLLLLSAGFDAHKNDPLASVELEVDDYRWLTEELMAIAHTCSQGKLVSVLEGGYHLPSLADCVRTHVLSLTH